MIIRTRRALGLRWLGWHKARQVRKHLVALRQKMETSHYSDYGYASTWMCCTREGQEIIKLIGKGNMRRLTADFNRDLVVERTRRTDCAYPVQLRYRVLYGAVGVEALRAPGSTQTHEEIKDELLAKIRKQLLAYWFKKLLGEEI